MGRSGVKRRCERLYNKIMWSCDKGAIAKVQALKGTCDNWGDIENGLAKIARVVGVK